MMSEVFDIWYLIGAAFVFFMQAGLAMVEAGFTCAKNASKIIMKNTMDFCLGTVAFLLVCIRSCAHRATALSDGDPIF